MNYNVKTIAVFERQAKRLIKKYPSLKEELFLLITSLTSDPEQGIALGNHSYKIRLSIASKGKGKSGGARIISHVYIIEKTVYLISIYDKAEQENITDKELQALIKLIP